MKNESTAGAPIMAWRYTCLAFLIAAVGREVYYNHAFAAFVMGIVCITALVKVVGPKLFPADKVS